MAENEEKVEAPTPDMGSENVESSVGESGSNNEPENKEQVETPDSGNENSPTGNTADEIVCPDVVGTIPAKPETPVKPKATENNVKASNNVITKSQGDGKKTLITIALTALITVGVVAGGSFIYNHAGSFGAGNPPAAVGVISTESSVPTTVNIANMNAETGVVTFIDKNGKVMPVKDVPKGYNNLSYILDGGCHFCWEETEANSEDVKAWIKSGKNSVSLKFIPMLYQQAKDQLKSSLTFPIVFSNIVTLAPNKAWDFYEAFYKKFPNEARTQIRDWTPEEYIKTLTALGVDKATINKALWATDSQAWVSKVTDWFNATVKNPNFTGTPFVDYNGKHLTDLYYMAPGSMKAFINNGGKVPEEFSIKALQAKQKAAETKNKTNKK